MITVTLHGKHGTRAIAIKPKGFGTRHVRVRREINPPVQPPPPLKSAEASHDSDYRRTTSERDHYALRDGVLRFPKPPVPVCPVLAALHKLTECYPGGNGYFIFDEIFVTVRQECLSLSRDALLETLRGYYRDGKIAFRRGYGSQLQFALEGNQP